MANQRFATVAPSTIATMPLPSPTTTPHSRVSCQASRINTVSPAPEASRTSAADTVRRSPKRSITATAKGPTSP